MKKKKQWFAVILAAMLVMGQGIIWAAPEDLEQKSGSINTEESVEAASTSASEEMQETQSKAKTQEKKEALEIGGGYFQKKEISPRKG